MQLLERLRVHLGDAYEIEGELAGGGMARVFLARDRSLNRRVVIKTLAAEPDSPVDAERFRREIRLAASLQQANIVPVLSTGEIDGVPYYTMPFVDGESLRSRLEALGALPVREAIGILRDVARALAFAHDHNVVHRDIKPENVLLSGNTAVVTDFGIARALDAARITGARPLDDATATANPNRLTVVGTALGTPAYMSPEQASSDPAVDHRADIYAFGVLAYELLSGAPPFTAPTVPALLAAHLARQPVPLAERAPRAPPELVALVMQCLEKEPGARPQSGRDLLAALDAGPVPDAVPARRTPASEKPSIAVLPFANLSPDPADEYFADGVTDEIITDLSALHGLHVIARASMMRFRKTTKDPATVARELNVRYVLDGSVRRAASTLRLTMRLLDTASNATIWSEKIGGSVEDVFAMQEKVSRTVVDALRVTMSPREDRRLTARAIDVRAYDAYLQARQYMWTFTVESLDRARHFLEHALATLGENARLVGTLGEVHLRYAEAGQQRPRDHLCEAERCAHRLAALDDESALLHSLRGQIHYLRGEIREAIDAFERARALEPNDANTACFLALMYGMAGRDAPAREAAEAAASLDPLTPLFQCMPGVCEFFSGHPDTALVFYRRFREMDPANPFAHLFVAWTTAHTGRRLEAATLAEHLARDFPGTVAADLAHALARALAGDVQGTRAAITPALYAAADDAEMYARGLMEIMALIGDAEGAAEAGERMLARGQSNYPHLAERNPFLAPYRDHPRIRRMLETARERWEHGGASAADHAARAAAR